MARKTTTTRHYVDRRRAPGERRIAMATSHRPRTLDAAIRERVAQIKAALAHLGWTQRRAAFAARVAETRFSDIMRGRVQPSPKEQQRIARVLQRSTETLFGQSASLLMLAALLGDWS